MLLSKKESKSKGYNVVHMTCGVAYMLVLLADDTLSHPPWICVFTVQEEVGLFGAIATKKEDIHAKRMINLDDGSKTLPVWQVRRV